MSFEVQFESPPGTYLTTRVFGPGQALRIGGVIRGWTGIGMPGVQMTLDISGPGITIYDSQTTGSLGGWFFDVILPNVNAKATIKITATYSIAGQEQMVIPIAIGSEIVPDPLPSPEPPKSPIESLLGVNLQPVLMLAAAVGVIALTRQK